METRSRRRPAAARPPPSEPADGLPKLSSEQSSQNSSHPSGAIKYGKLMQLVRGLACGLYFFTSCICIHTTQLLGLPLYILNRPTYYAWMSITKQHFALLMMTITHIWSPVVVRISGDASMNGQLTLTDNGDFVANFPERIVLVANHQIYTDWLYLWWIAYCARMHGHVYIVLKQSLKYIPLLGLAMQLYSFIFLARRWALDKERIRYRIEKLSQIHIEIDGARSRPPMWLLLFPEGTNLSANTRSHSASFAKKSGVDDLQHALLPRSTGFDFALSQLGNSVEYIYDCTIAYEAIPPGQYGQDLFTIRSVYLQGRPPRSVNMHWRRFRVDTLPVGDARAMDEWVHARWREKDDLLQRHLETGRFPADSEAIAKDTHGRQTGYIETQVRQRHWFEIVQIFVPVIAVWLLARIVVTSWQIFRRLLSGG